MQPRDYYARLEKEAIRCPITGSERWLDLVTGDRYGMGLRTQICADSGFIATNPRPTAQELLKFYAERYRDYYFHFPDPTSQEYQASANRAVSRRRARWLADYCEAELAALRQQRDGAPLRILDVGCADGCFLTEIARRLRAEDTPLQSFAVEPDPAYGRYAAAESGATVYQGGLEEHLGRFRGADRGFDLVVLSHVLEHLCEPDQVLRQLRSLLAEGGLLLVEVPNLVSPCWSGNGMFHIAHISHFIPETLAALLEVASFSVEKLFHGIHPADPWAMTALARSARPAALQDYGIAPIVARPLYGPSNLDSLIGFVRSRSGLPAQPPSRPSLVRRVGRGLRSLVR
jgi:2-polyprenyl-3-methyl-5-hydroxy-6-metoxy-1,4-benzoquinol methylase